MNLIPAAKDALILLNSPVAKQLLIQNYVLSGQTLTADNSVHTAFFNELNQRAKRRRTTNFGLTLWRLIQRSINFFDIVLHI